MSIQKGQPLIQAVLVYAKYFSGDPIRPDASIPAAKTVEPAIMVGLKANMGVVFSTSPNNFL